ncbi:MAG: hypothetical protein PHQ58_10845 [Rhodoferax sp.]|uniref:hypothetical protein n=1 Tax=Rhodoferax sp. TaxID=50421 RepID=UPI0026282F08|nr:hypothetical protein [Rhodoferax sp.]MDD2880928.1 hypothetical protein [Rhodoferax sp.]
MYAATVAHCPPGHHSRVKSRWMSNQDIESATAQVLTQGGDTRIELNAAGVNIYACGPRPDPALVQFGSSTGSVISSTGFQAAVALYKRLYNRQGDYHAEVERQRCELSALSGASRLPGIDVVFAASGTDIHLFAAQLATLGQRTPLQAVMVEPAETGSGVPAALAALHFATRTSQGRPVTCGVPLSDTPLQPPLGVKLRQTDGSLRSVAEVDAEFAAHVNRLMLADGRCMLVMTDVSKTGLLAPSLACATALRQRFGDQLTVLVDACQFRLSSEALLGYLSQDFMVAITGSKFIGGPAFCGALLLPPAVAQSNRMVSLKVLADYSARSDWPPGWLPAKALAESVNLGVLLRWEAALTELRRFRAIPDHVVHDFLQAWQQAVTSRIAQDDSFEVLPVLPLARSHANGLQPWDSVQTIFPFQVFKPKAGGGRQALSQEETAHVHRQLRDPQGAFGAPGTRFQLGQPVLCGLQGGEPVSALRMCSSARLVTESMAARQPVDKAIAQAMRAFDKLAQLAQALR